MGNSIKFNLNPNAHDIEHAGHKIKNFLKSQLLSDETIQSQIALLKELLESGIKYGKLSPTGNEIDVHIHIENKTITLEVKNPIDDNCWERLIELDENIQFIRGYHDPLEAYMTKKAEASLNPSHEKNEGINLSKIAYRSKAILDFFVNENNILNLTAVRNLDGEMTT